MKLIKYSIKINFVDKNGKEVELQTYASSAVELLKNLKEILEKKSKNYILNIFGL